MAWWGLVVTVHDYERRLWVVVAGLGVYGLYLVCRLVVSWVW